MTDNTLPEKDANGNIIKTHAEAPKETVMLNKTLATRYAQWQSAHGDKTPPIYLDENKQPQWVSRKQRRALAAQIRRKSK